MFGEFMYYVGMIVLLVSALFLWILFVSGIGVAFDGNLEDWVDWTVFGVVFLSAVGCTALFLLLAGN